MLAIKESQLRDGTKMEILRRLFVGDSVSDMLKDFEPDQVVEAQRFLWEKTLEFGIRTQGAGFSKAKVFKRFKSISTYQKEVNCGLPVRKCRSISCFYSNRGCALGKAKDHIDIMCEAMHEILGIHQQV